MAIKVNGQVVIDDSRQLTNIASVDAATTAAFGAAGLGGGSETFEATGSVTAGDAVGFLSDGTVKTVSQFTSSNVQYTGSTPDWLDFTYDTTNDKIVAVYSVSSTVYAVSGTISNGQISWTTPKAIKDSTPQYLSVVHDPSSGKCVLVWHLYYNTQLNGTVLDASGTNITNGSIIDIYANNSSPYRDVKLVSDPINNKVVLFSDRGFEDSKAVVITVSGTSLSFGSATSWTNNGNPNQFNPVYDSTSGKIVLFYNSDQGGVRARVATVSGTSISFGTEVTVSGSESVSSLHSAYDPVADRHLLIFFDSTAKGFYNVCQVSGTSLSFQASPTKWSDSTTTVHNNLNVVYNPSDDRMHVFYYESAITSLNHISCAVNSTDATFDLVPSTIFPAQVSYLKGVYDPDNVSILVGGRGAAGYGAVSFTVDTTSSYNGYIGVAAEDIADGATGSITITGGINDNFTGLAAGGSYYLQTNGSVLNSPVTEKRVGVGLTSTKMLIK